MEQQESAACENIPEEVKVWELVPVRNLQGMCAIRICPLYADDYDTPNYCHTHQAVWIKEVLPTGHINCGTKYNKNHLMNFQWNDECWVRAPDSWCKKSKDIKNIRKKDDPRE